MLSVYVQVPGFSINSAESENSKRKEQVCRRSKVVGVSLYNFLYPH